MCKAMEEHTKKTAVLSAIKILKFNNIPTEEMIRQITELYNVSREYVEELLKPVAV